MWQEIKVDYVTTSNREMIDWTVFFLIVVSSIETQMYRYLSELCTFLGPCMWHLSMPWCFHGRWSTILWLHSGKLYIHSIAIMACIIYKPRVLDIIYDVTIEICLNEVVSPFTFKYNEYLPMFLLVPGKKVKNT